MSVATHLGLNVGEYDRRIRTFIPDYEEMLLSATAALRPQTRSIIDLGIGTGALAAYCLRRSERAQILGIDTDTDMLKLAARRLGNRAAFICADFLRAPLPACDAVVASFALHHVRTQNAKARLFGRIRTALCSRGRFVSVDCHPAADRDFARQQHQAWRSHLQRSYTPSQAKALLRSWSRQDVYMSLESEISLMERSGFSVHVLWRKNAFAVLVGTRR